MRIAVFLAITCSAIAVGASPQAGTPAGARTAEVVRHDNVTIEYVAEGQGPLVVVVPSLGRDAIELAPLAERIAAAGFRVVRPRPRGFGRSTGPLEHLTLHDFARDIAAVIEHERAGPAIMVGHAYGHFVAKMTAVDFPRLVRGVALVAATQKNMDPEVRRWNAIASDPTRPEAERLKYLQLVFFAPGHDPAIWLTGFQPDVRRSQDLAREATPQHEYWASGTVPLLDLQAAMDPYRPRSTASELIEEFGRARVTVAVIPNTSHALPVEAPAPVADAIVGWARQLKADPRASGSGQ